jgi:L,D-transpeptidase catalytic domain
MYPTFLYRPIFVTKNQFLMTRRKLINPVPGALIVSLLLSPFLLAGTNPVHVHEATAPAVVSFNTSFNVIEPAPPIEMEKAATAVYYDSLRLQKIGLSKTAFEYAMKGYRYMRDRGWINRPGIMTICDFSQSSRRKRLYVVDLRSYRVVLNTYVAHGKNSGGEYANSFSNTPESNKSSLGFYLTSATYYGNCGYSLRLKGFDRGFNDNAYDRDIVMHGSDYVGEDYLRNSNAMGRSFGCPAVPAKYHKKIIDFIKNGSCLFIYHPSKQYLRKSRIINS